MSKDNVSFWDWILASIITGTTVVVMQGIFEGVFRSGIFGDSVLVRLLINMLVSGASGFVAIMLVDVSGLLG